MNRKNYIIPIFIPHKGCPHDCIFCNQKRIAGNIVETTGEDVKEVISNYLRTLPKGNHHREIAFYGGSFTGLPLEKQEELLVPAFDYVKKGVIDGIRLSTRPDYITRNILSFLSDYGVTTIELGVQSTNDEVLHLSQRGHTKKDVDEAVGLIKEYNIKLGLQMMIGLPGDEKKVILKTVADFITYKPDFVRIYPTIVIKDTMLEKLYRTGEYTPFTIEECVELSKYALLSFQENNIPVIRLGLQSTEEITYGKGIVAGPYHPAFREMVETEIFRGKIESELILLKSRQENLQNITIYCHQRDASKVAGYKQSNRKYFIDQYALKHLNIRISSDIEEGTVKVGI
ncbi:elongator complex protein 3 [Alkaliphilus transvaalensis]|uniref:elongator complex protein 3 n=1 Tax=Alkaliphilus transvaalensis TaxID=114628 RepID=UPI00055838DA|nr:radical SAM protein [Alkaliphilus transvaalensis]